MADEPDKTERATPQRLRQARAEGQVPRSREWTLALGLLVSLQLIVMQTPAWLDSFRRLFRLAFPPLGGDAAMDNALSHVFSDSVLLMARMVMPLFAIPLIVCAGSLVPGGFTFSLDHLQPKFGRMNPFGFFGRLFQPKNISDTALHLVKAAMVGIVLFFVVRSSIASYVQLQGEDLGEAIPRGTHLVLDGVMALCAVFVLLAVIDLPLQSFLHARSQRMSKQEIKDEMKQSEGRPQIKQKIRQLQLQLSRRTVRKTVPTADVVIVNPEHYAVALKYDDKRAQAPFVIAKGVDEMALYIRRVAAEHAVEVLELPPLARAIYNTSQVNQQVPGALYEAVARVLSYVFQIQAFRDGRRRTRPQPSWSDLSVPEHLSRPT